MKRLLTAIALASLLATSAPATAGDLVVETGFSTAYYNDTAFDAFSAVNFKTDWTLEAAWDFDRFLRAGLMFQTTPRLELSRFGGATFIQWGRQKIFGTAQWGFYPFRYLRAYVEGGGGYVHQFLSVESSGPRLKDHAHDLGGLVGLGLQLGVPVRWGRIGLTSSVGYEGQTSAKFDEMRHDRKAFEDKYEPDDDPWDRAHADYGSLALHGVYWTVALTVAFGL